MWHYPPLPLAGDVGRTGFGDRSGCPCPYGQGVFHPGSVRLAPPPWATHLAIADSNHGGVLAAQVGAGMLRGFCQALPCLSLLLAGRTHGAHRWPLHTPTRIAHLAVGTTVTDACLTHAGLAHLPGRLALCSARCLSRSVPALWQVGAVWPCAGPGRAHPLHACHRPVRFACANRSTCYVVQELPLYLLAVASGWYKSNVWPSEPLLVAVLAVASGSYKMFYCLQYPI